MRISDWSSDVCSSDLSIEHVIHTHADKPESQYSCTATIEPARWPARVAGRCPTLKTTRCRTPPGCRRRPCRLHRDATKRWTFPTLFRAADTIGQPTIPRSPAYGADIAPARNQLKIGRAHV